MPLLHSRFGVFVWSLHKSLSAAEALVDILAQVAAHWSEVAAACGAKRVRVLAGDAAPGEMDREGFTRCLKICQDDGFIGPEILIFGDPGDEWQSPGLVYAAVLPFCGDFGGRAGHTQGRAA